MAEQAEPQAQMAALGPLADDPEGIMQFIGLASVLSRRLRLTDTFEGERNVWKSCGYPVEVREEAMELRYKRFGLARQVVNAYPNYCWMKDPEVYETEEGDETAFEKEWKALVGKFHVYNRLKTVDKLAGRGEFAILLIGLDDGKDVKEEAAGTNNVIFLRPYHPSKVKISKTEEDTNSARYGLPTLYEVEKKDKAATKSFIHWTRVLHVADGTDEKDHIGEHRLLQVWNHILDIEKIAGGGSEMFWKGGFPGMGFEMDKDSSPTSTQLTAINTELEKYFHGMTRYFKLKGVKPHQFSPNVADPQAHFTINVQLISAATGQPTRVLLGSEQAQLASGQDIANWLERVETRRTQFCEPNILLAFIDRLEMLGVLTAPEEKTVKWPPLKTRTEKEKAETAKITTEAIAKYAATPGIGLVMDLFSYLTEVLEYSQDKANAIVKNVNYELEKEANEEEPPEEEEEELEV